MFSHIFNAPKRTGFKFVLILSASQDISQPGSDEKFFNTKAEAKAYAKSVSAQPHNY